jgi:uroporphyrinogen decarboxylase
MDFVKIQYELRFPQQPEIKDPEDWDKLNYYGVDFYQDQLFIVEELVKALKNDAHIIMTLYSPFMCAGQVVGKGLLSTHIKENPDMVKKGLETITGSLLSFARGCIQRGIDGFYHSTQGGETSRFGNSKLFEDCIMPYDLYLMNEINNSSDLNILHVCDYHGSYSDYDKFIDYPGDIVSCNQVLNSSEMEIKEISELFRRPYMGGLDRNGVIVTRGNSNLKYYINTILNKASKDFVLGANCTLPSDIKWKNIKNAIQYAHEFSN